MDTKPAAPTATFQIADVILVTEITSSDLGLHYEREVLSEQCIGEREETRFETLRVYDNKPEALRARAVHEQARARLRKVCSKTVLGLVCAASREAELQAAMAEIETLIAQANSDLQRCSIDFRIVPIRIEHSNHLAHQALERDVRRHAEALVEATRSLDPVAIRRVLRAGKGLDALIADESVRAGLAHMNDAAREAARAIGKATLAAGGDASLVPATPAVRAATEAVAARFPWAAAFDVEAGAAEAAA